MRIKGGRIDPPPPSRLTAALPPFAPVAAAAKYTAMNY